MKKNLIFTAEQKEQMLAHVNSVLNEEVCGLLGGNRNEVVCVIPVTNVTHSATRFLMDANEQARAFIYLENQGLELLGIYHSHLHGPSIPSEIDIREFAYPGVFQLIWFPGPDGNWELLGYLIVEDEFNEIEIVCSGHNMGLWECPW